MEELKQQQIIFKKTEVFKSGKLNTWIEDPWKGHGNGK